MPRNDPLSESLIEAGRYDLTFQCQGSRARTDAALTAQPRTTSVGEELHRRQPRWCLPALGSRAWPASPTVRREPTDGQPVPVALLRRQGVPPQPGFPPAGWIRKTL
jgi:hypothetical protein